MKYFNYLIKETLYFLILIFSFTISLSADVIHVPGDQPTIQNGLNAASFGDTVLVAPGTYFENIIWPEVNGIKLIGAGRENTIIDGSGQASVIRFESLDIIGNETLVKGFTITNGNALPPWPESQGGGIYIYDSHPILEDLTITENTADDFGGGIYVWLADPIIRYCEIINNTATSHAGVDCLLGDPVFDHCTFSNNDPGGLYFDTRDNPDIINSIVAFNNFYGVRIHGTSFGTTTVNIGYSDMYDDIQLIGAASYIDLGGIIEDDPLFVNAANDNYHLLENSPCIDTGDPNYPLDPDGTRTDMGAFYFDQVVPVELTSFTANILNAKVKLEWKTSTETNNKGFEIQKSQISDVKRQAENWINIGFVEGKGTTTESQNYFFIDENISSGKYAYMLKQIDYDGSFEYSDIVEVDLSNVPKHFSLKQNYPNPFNPTTIIKYNIPEASQVQLKIFDILGNEVKTLVNNYKEAGSYDISWNATDNFNKNVSSGIYFYTVKAGDFTATKKLVLIR